jgi:hypothetical protein
LKTKPDGSLKKVHGAEYSACCTAAEEQATMADTDDFARRAEQEARLASQATHPAAVAAHHRLATAYVGRLRPARAPEGS